MPTTTIERTFPEPDIAVLTLDMPGKGANVLSRSVLAELSSHLDELEQRHDLAGLIVTSGKPGQFIAGADLREFAASLDVPQETTIEMCRQGQRLFGRLARTPYVTIAAIDGICVGGGAEFASWCDRRIMSDSSKTQFGFPEVKLGLYPGWGGTVRAPRIAGPYNAVEMITSGESISARDAYRMGWCSDLVPAEQLVAAAIRLAREEQRSQSYVLSRQRWKQAIRWSATEIGFLGAAASGYIQSQTKGHYPAPMAALETILGGISLDSDEACELEATGMAELFGSAVNAALLNVFFLTDANKKDRGIEKSDIQPRPIQSVAVLGTGLMGSGIAAAHLKRGCDVVITDVSVEAIQKGKRAILEEVSYNRETKGLDAKLAVDFASRLEATRDESVLASCDLVVEAVVEKEEIKRSLLSRLQPLMPPTAILASNTSTIPITRLAESLPHPDRFCGMHYFNPVRKMKLVEVIRGAKTSDETVVSVVAQAKALGKMPIVVKDGPGFLVNRLLLPYMDEALKLVEEGNPIEAIDKAAKRFGMPMGPIELYDMVGLDTALYAGRVLVDAFPDRFRGSEIVPTLVQAGRLGQKSGLGFFSYQNKKGKAQPDPELPALLQPLIGAAAKRLKTEEITDRLFLPMLVEGSRILAEGLVRHARDIDIGMIFGTGFPPFRGGLMAWGDTLGAEQVVERLQPYASLGQRFTPTELMRRCARDGRKFYQLDQ